MAFVTTAPRNLSEVEEYFGRTHELAIDVGLTELPKATKVIFDPESECWLVIEYGIDPGNWKGF